MKKLMISSLLVLVASQLLAFDVPILTKEQAAFMKLTPAGRRSVFTNKEYRAALAVHDWDKMQWRAAAKGETSRWRRLPGIPNLRDLGGLKGLDGRMVLTGKIFRSGGFNNNACKLYSEADVLKMYKKGTLLTAVPKDSVSAAKKIKTYLDAGEKSKADLTHLVKEWCPGAPRLNEETLGYQRGNFGIRTDLDLRSDRECYGMEGSPLGPQTKFVHIPSSAYASIHSDNGKASFKKDFAIFLDRGNYPIGFHCIAGADRTGSLAYILEALLGVSDEDLVLDWELTAFHNPNHKFAHAERYDKLVAGFKKYPGATTRERVEAYVMEQGFTMEDIKFFRSMMLSPVVREITMLEGEGWWGVENYYGTKMPFNKDTVLEMDIRKEGHSNQYASILVSDKGRVIWCENQIGVSIANGVIRVESDTAIDLVVAKGGTLREAFKLASAKYFPPAGTTPDLLFFSAPQYNTWIELTYHQNQKDILAYAKAMLDNGLPPGVFMIDDTWQLAYGTWEFDPRRFDNPKKMMDELHAMGYKVMLWMCPYVGMDTPEFRRLAWGANPDDVKGWPTKGGLLMDYGGERAASIPWWNGFSAYLDLTHPNGNAWLKEQLDRLVKDYGADGFKLDGGHLPPYTRGLGVYRKNATSGEQVMEYAKYSLMYPCCEYRNAWRFQGQPVVERLHDKAHTWEALQKLIPDMVAGGLLGHQFMCPDMIGGGSHSAFLPGAPFDPDLFVRSAQVHALCGMMQFSASPWRYLDESRQQIIRDIVKMRQQKFAAKFVELAKECAKSGEPMIRNLEYMYPHQGYAAIQDEFIMGDDLLVAPVVVKDAASREVVIPPGTWVADDGTEVKGPCRVTVKTPLSRLPYFQLKR